MKVVAKHIVLLFFMVVYSLFIFSPSVDFASHDYEEQTETVSDGYYLTEISKVLFPQTIQPNAGAISAVHIAGEDSNDFEKNLVAIVELNKRLLIEDVNCLRESDKIELQFKRQDIIFPFHTFF